MGLAGTETMLVPYLNSNLEKKKLLIIISEISYDAECQTVNTNAECLGNLMCRTTNTGNKCVCADSNVLVYVDNNQCQSSKYLFSHF